MRKVIMDDSEQNIKKEISRYFDGRNTGARSDNLVRLGESIKYLAKDYKGTDKWIIKFRDGEVVYNNFGKKLFFKFG